MKNPRAVLGAGLITLGSLAVIFLLPGPRPLLEVYNESGTEVTVTLRLPTGDVSRILKEQSRWSVPNLAKGSCMFTVTPREVTLITTLEKTVPPPMQGLDPVRDKAKIDQLWQEMSHWNRQMNPLLDRVKHLGLESYQGSLILTQKRGLWRKNTYTLSLHGNRWHTSP